MNNNEYELYNSYPTIIYKSKDDNINKFFCKKCNSENIYYELEIENRIMCKKCKTIYYKNPEYNDKIMNTYFLCCFWINW